MKRKIVDSNSVEWYNGKKKKSIKCFLWKLVKAVFVPRVTELLTEVDSTGENSPLRLSNMILCWFYWFCLIRLFVLLEFLIYLKSLILFILISPKKNNCQLKALFPDRVNFKSWSYTYYKLQNKQTTKLSKTELFAFYILIFSKPCFSSVKWILKVDQ